MDILATCLLASIILMMAVVYNVARFISTADASRSGNGNIGLWHALVNACFRNDEYYKNWVKEYNVYYWSVLFMWCLVITILGLLGSFSNNKIFNRPEVSLIVAIPLWMSMLKCFQWYHRKFKEFSNNSNTNS